MSENEKVYFASDFDEIENSAFFQMSGYNEEDDAQIEACDRNKYFADKDARRKANEEQLRQQRRSAVVHAQIERAIMKKKIFYGNVVGTERILKDGEEMCSTVILLRDKNIGPDTIKVVIPYDDFYMQKLIGTAAIKRALESAKGREEYIRRQEQMLAKHTRNGGLKVPFVIMSYEDKPDFIECVASRRNALSVLRQQACTLDGGPKTGDVITATVMSVSHHGVSLTALGVDFTVPHFALTFRWYDSLDFEGSPYKVGSQVDMVIKDFSYNRHTNAVERFNCDPKAVEREYFASRLKLLRTPCRTDDAVITRIYKDESTGKLSIYLYCPSLDIIGKCKQVPPELLKYDIDVGSRVIFRITGKSPDAEGGSESGCFAFGFIRMLTGDSQVFNTRHFGSRQ